VIRMQGEVLEGLPDASFRVRLENGHEVLGRIAARMQVLRLLPGDRVTVELTPNDLSRARIVISTR
jgi:translation initiation factor IF-1